MHRQKHPVDVDGCFGCKLLSLEFGIVPGAYRSENGSYVDHDSIRDNGIPTMEEVNDRRTDLYRSAGDAGVEEFDIGSSRSLAQWAEK
jgi:hypothetical protein